jgi:predicted outer membrane lipoprotein
LVIWVAGVPLAAAIALFGILWAVLRLPKQKLSEEAKSAP